MKTFDICSTSRTEGCGIFLVEEGYLYIDGYTQNGQTKKILDCYPFSILRYSEDPSYHCSGMEHEPQLQLLGELA